MRECRQPFGQRAARRVLHPPARVRDRGRLLAEVEDNGSSWNGAIGVAQPPHGLYLLQTMATDCGTRRGQWGWITWFTLTAAGDPMLGAGR